MDDFINVADDVDNRPGTSDWSISLWFWAANADQAGPLICKRVTSSPYNQLQITIGDSSTDVLPGKRLQAIVIGTHATGDDGANNTGLTAKGEEVLSYP